MQHSCDKASSANLISLQTKDFDALAQGIPGWDTTFSQVSPGPFFGRLELLPLPGITLCCIEVNREVLARGDHRPGTTGFGFPRQHLPPSLVSGQQMKPGQIITLGPNQTLDQKTGTHYQAVFVEMEDHLFHQTMQTLTQREDYGGPDPTALLKPSQEAADRVSRQIYRILTRVKNSQAALVSPSHLRKMLHQLMVHQATMLTDPQDPDTLTGRWRSRRALVMEAEQLMDQDSDGSITILDLCEHLVVSERSLHYAFEEICSQTPMTWYRMKRLNAVRRMLKHADPAHTSISKVAKDAGFPHPGAFAAAYHHLFGELPSETLG